MYYRVLDRKTVASIPNTVQKCLYRALTGIPEFKPTTNTFLGSRKGKQTHFGYDVSSVQDTGTPDPRQIELSPVHENLTGLGLTKLCFCKFLTSYPQPKLVLLQKSFHDKGG